jgi:hypothetical protein
MAAVMIALLLISAAAATVIRRQTDPFPSKGLDSQLSYDLYDVCHYSSEGGDPTIQHVLN